MIITVKIINMDIGYLFYTWSDKALKYTVVNRALPSLHVGSLAKFSQYYCLQLKLIFRGIIWFGVFPIAYSWFGAGDLFAKTELDKVKETEQYFSPIYCIEEIGIDKIFLRSSLLQNWLQFSLNRKINLKEKTKIPILN